MSTTADIDKAIERAKWIVSQYRDISPEHAIAGMPAVLGDMLADLEVLADALGYSWSDVEAVQTMAKAWITSDGNLASAVGPSWFMDDLKRRIAEANSTISVPHG